MKSNVVKFLLIFFSISILTSCDLRLSTADLTEEVINSMNEAYKTDPATANIKIESLILTRVGKDSNEYSGVLKTTEPNGNFTYTVKVVYDGENMTWQSS